VANGTLTFTATEPGDHEIPMQICAAPKATDAKPGVDEVQQLAWAGTYTGAPLNAHPLALSLAFEGQKTDLIGTSFGNQWFNQGVPTPLMTDWLQWIGSDFRAPSAAQVEAALAKLPNIGAGNVKVTGGDAGTPYSIAFVGALAGKDVGQVTVGDWYTHLPAEGLDQVLAAATSLSPAPDPNAPPAPPLPTWDALNNQLISGQITTEQWSATAGDILKAQILGSIDVPKLLAYITSLFPAKPTLDTTVQGEAAIAAGSTGNLCTPFVVRYTLDGTGALPGVLERTPTGQSGAPLALTGSDSTGLALLAMGMIAVGGGLVLIRRREQLS
jgi:LPXTG-motif cell wall-anchored protein